MSEQEPKRRGRKPKISRDGIDCPALPETMNEPESGAISDPIPTGPAPINGVPVAPEMDPAQGDKTPAFVEWMRDFHPEEFSKRYANRKTHLTEKNAE